MKKIIKSNKVRISGYIDSDLFEWLMNYKKCNRTSKNQIIVWALEYYKEKKTKNEL